MLQQTHRQLLLRTGEHRRLIVQSRQQRNRVIVRAETTIHTHRIDRQEVRTLTLQLLTTQLQRSLLRRTGLRRKTNNELRTEGTLPRLTSLLAAHNDLTQNIRVAHQLNHRRILRIGALLNLELGKLGGPKISHRRGHNQHIRRRARLKGRLTQLQGADHTGHLHTLRRGNLKVRTNQVHGRAQVACRLRERHALLAGRTVAEEAYRVQRLTGAAGGNDHEATGKRTTQRFGCASFPTRISLTRLNLTRLSLTKQRRSQRRRTRRRQTLLLRARVQGLSRRVTGRVHRVHLTLREARNHIQSHRENILRLRHATRTRIRARQTPNRRLNHVVTPRTQSLHIRLSRRMLPHLGMHRRRQNHRGVRSQHRGGQQIIRTTSRQTSQQISGRRGNHHSVSLFSLTHVVHLRNTVKHVR